MMPVYSYHCKECGERQQLECDIDTYGQIRDTIGCCDRQMSRVYDNISIQPGFVEHYNTSLGKRVTRKQEFQSDLARLSDEQSERLGGMPVNYQPIDPHDAKSMVERKGVESRERKVRELRADARAKTRQEILSTLDSKGG